MKRIVAITLTIMMIHAVPFMTTQAHAASIDESLLGTITQAPNLAQIQQLIDLKKLQQSNKDELLGNLAKAALSKIDTTRIEAATIAANENMTKISETALRQQIEQAVTTKFEPYKNEISALSALLGGSSIQLNSQATRDNNSLTGEPQNYKRIINMTATAYGPGTQDNGKWNDSTYMGGIVRKGVAAVDPRVIPMGSKIWVEGYGEAIAEDQGSAIKGNRIDLAFNTRNEALDYGIQNVKVYVLN